MKESSDRYIAVVEKEEEMDALHYDGRLRNAGFRLGYLAANFPENLSIHGKILRLVDQLKIRSVVAAGYSKIILMAPSLRGEALAVADAVGLPVLPLEGEWTAADWLQPGVMPRRKRHKTVGILGGMGPLATGDLFTKIVTATPATCDQEHLRIVVENSPDMSDRVESLMNRGPSPIAALRECGYRLERSGADMIVIPCNTAHAFLPDLRKYWKIPVLSIIDTAVEYVRREYSSVKRVGLLATSGTIVYHVYSDCLEKAGLEALMPTPEEQMSLVTRSIYPPDGVKAGKLENPRKWLAEIADRLAQRGAELIIMGCTEIPLAMHPEDVQVPVVDPTEILAKATVKAAWNNG